MFLFAYLGEFIFSQSGSATFLSGMSFPTDASSFLYDPSFSSRFGRIGIYGQTELVLKDFSIQMASVVVPVGIVAIHGGIKTQGVSSYFYDDTGQIAGSMGERHVEVVAGLSRVFKFASSPKLKSVSVGGSAIVYTYSFYAGDTYAVNLLVPALEMGVSLSLGNILTYGSGLFSAPPEQVLVAFHGGFPLLFNFEAGSWRGGSPFHAGGALAFYPLSWAMLGFSFDYNSWTGSGIGVSVELYFADLLARMIGSRFAVAPLLRMGVPIGDDLRVFSFGVGGYFTASRSYYRGERVLATDRVDVGFNWGLVILKGGLENILSVDLRF